jgi:hypothetical protein
MESESDGMVLGPHLRLPVDAAGLLKGCDLEQRRGREADPVPGLAPGSAAPGPDVGHGVAVGKRILRVGRVLGAPVDPAAPGDPGQDRRHVPDPRLGEQTTGATARSAIKQRAPKRRLP